MSIGGGGRALALDFGRTYLVCGEQTDQGMHLLHHLARAGCPTMCLSRVHPDLLTHNLRQQVEESYWLSERPGPRNLPPAQLTRLVHAIACFVHCHDRAAVMLDGIEYLCLFNDFYRIHIFVEQLNDLVMDTGAILLMPIDPRLFDQRSLARLRRFAEVVR